MTATETNIWSSFLKESSKRSQNQESSCLLFGDDACGKRHLTHTLCANSSEVEASVNHQDVVSYSYFDVEDKDVEAPTRVNMWLFGSKIVNHAFDIVYHSRTEKVSVSQRF